VSGAVWTLEWRIARVRRRLFLLNLGVPLGLVALIALSGAPAFHASAVYSVLFVFHGVFGSAIPLTRDARSGLLTRTVRAGVSARELLLERAAAGAVLDALQLAPSLALIVWTAPASFGSLPGALAILAGSLWVANLVGSLLAAVARSLAEGALVSAVGALLLLHASGVFRTGPPGSVTANVEALAPFSVLHDTLLGLTTSVPAPGWIVLLLWSVVLPAVFVPLADAIMRRLQHVDGTQ